MYERRAGREKESRAKSRNRRRRGRNPDLGKPEGARAGPKCPAEFGTAKRNLGGGIDVGTKIAGWRKSAEWYKRVLPRSLFLLTWLEGKGRFS